MKTACFLLFMVSVTTAMAHIYGGNHTMGRVKRELLQRSKRRWVLSTIELVEEDPGPFPKKATQMFNDQTKDGNDYKFRILGNGIDKDPKGVFRIGEKDGWVYVLKSIDREQYSLFHIKFDILDPITNELVDRTLAFDIAIKDINDNAPYFDKTVIDAKVKENTLSGDLPVSLTARDMDADNTENSTISMRVVSQDPKTPKISLKQVQGTKTSQLNFEGCFDYDKYKSYKVIVEARDHGKPSLSSSATINLAVMDANTHPPVFKQTEYNGEVMEMEVNKEVVRIGVTDGDTPNTPGWRAKFFFIKGNEDNNYKIETDPTTNEGILTVIKGKNYERTVFAGLQIGVENEEPLFVCGEAISKETPRALASTNVTVKVIDVNDPPQFAKTVSDVYQKEEEEPGKVIFQPTVTDEDSDLNKIRFKVTKDPAGWVTIDPVTGKITTAKKMDRESPFVDKNGVYPIEVIAVDDGEPPATATSTVNIHLGDTNDNVPLLVHESQVMCVDKSERIMVPASDLDGPPFSGPFAFNLGGDDSTLKSHWKLDPSIGNETGLINIKSLPYGNYSVTLVIQDQQGYGGTNTLVVSVCQCGEGDVCRSKLPLSTKMGPAAIGLLLAGLLFFLLLLLAVLCRCQDEKFVPSVIYGDEGNQTLIKYNEEGGGSSNQTMSHIFMAQNSTMTDGVRQDTLPMGQMNQLTTEEMTDYRMERTMQLNNQMSSMSEANGTLRNQRGGRGMGTANPRTATWGTSKLPSEVAMEQYSTWNTSRMTSERQRSGAARYSRSFSMMSNQNIADHLDRKLYVIGVDHENYPEDQPYCYAYEGQGSKCQSLDQLSLSNLGEDLQFLDNLGPKFRPLEGLCRHDMEAKNVNM